MIEVTNLSKAFGSFMAVDGVSFQVNKGEILAFLGPNGAGKSTTMKMLTCFLTPSGGDATVCGISILKDPIAVRKKVGYMPENAPLYGDLTVLEFLNYIADLREISEEERENALKRVIETCSLQTVINQIIDTLSKGYKRRVSLAQALIHDPEVLILDEPTDGLDPNQKHEVRSLIKHMAKEKCIILSTHILEEMEACCTRAVIISNGEIKFNGTPGELKAKSNNGQVDDVFRAITTRIAVEGVSI